MHKLVDSLNYQPVELKFGTSGLRGLVADMTDLECYINTAGFLRFLALPENSQICLAGDLRKSTPQIMVAVGQAIIDAGHRVLNCGFVPTPAVAFYGLQHNLASIMVTGSHIPDDRNGIKFYKPDGEILKADEMAISAAVALARQEIYVQDAAKSIFTFSGALLQPARALLDNPSSQAADAYLDRYTRVFDQQTLLGKKIVFYQHSAVGRDLLVNILQKLGADIVTVGRCEKFLPIDTENVTVADKAYFKQLAQDNPDVYAIVSTDGDSDRPFVVDAVGDFHRGDELGVVVAKWLGADFAAFPISTNDGVDKYLTQSNIAWQHTKIGSPYVIDAMQSAMSGKSQCVVGWEVNGGFLTGSELKINGQSLAALPTRDALLPIIIALKASLDAHKSVAELFLDLPQRFTSAGLIDNFPISKAKQVVDLLANPEFVVEHFESANNFGAVSQINTLDGVRIYFDNGEIVHVRASGNAPQLRVYSVADSQFRADQIVDLAIAEPSGILTALA